VTLNRPKAINYTAPGIGLALAQVVKAWTGRRVGRGGALRGRGARRARVDVVAILKSARADGAEARRFSARRILMNGQIVASRRIRSR